MAVSRKAMTEGIRTTAFLSTSNKARFYNPSVKNQRFLPAPFAQGSRGCSRTSTFFGNKMPPVLRTGGTLRLLRSFILNSN